MTRAWGAGGPALRRFVLMNTTPTQTITRPAATTAMVANPRRTRI